MTYPTHLIPTTVVGSMPTDNEDFVFGLGTNDVSANTTSADRTRLN